MSNWKLAAANARFSSLTSASFLLDGTAETWSAWTDFDATTPRNVTGIVLFRSEGATTNRYRVELGFASGNAVVVSGGLAFCGTGTANNSAQAHSMVVLPLELPAGVTPCFRIQQSGTNSTVTVTFRMYYITGGWLWPIAPLSLIDVQGWSSGVVGTSCAANTNTQIATVSSTKRLRAVNIASIDSSATTNAGGTNIIMNVALDTGTTQYIAERRMATTTTDNNNRYAGHWFSYADHMIPCNAAKSSAVYARTSVARSVVLALGY